MWTNRQNKICAQLPPDVEALGIEADPRQLLMAETEVYGLISGPSWLRQSLVAPFEEIGYRRNPYDKCIMTLLRQDTPGVLRASKSKGNGAAGSSSSGDGAGSHRSEHLNEGIIFIEVDDILEGGYFFGCLGCDFSFV